jgi:hypothetical protein
MKVTDTEKVKNVLDSVQKGLVVRKIDIEDIPAAVDEIEEKLKKLMPKKYWTGIKVFIDLNAQSFPNSYNGVPMSTQIMLVRNTKDWIVKDIFRAPCHSGGNEYLLEFPRTEDLGNIVLKYVSRSINW